jgi:hypothetical protein
MRKARRELLQCESEILFAFAIESFDRRPIKGPSWRETVTGYVFSNSFGRNNLETRSLSLVLRSLSLVLGMSLVLGNEPPPITDEDRFV